MILTCPECSTRYLVASHSVGAEGRTVRCSSCSNTWFQDPEEEEQRKDDEENLAPIPDSVKPIPEGSSVPVVADRSNNGAIMGYLSAAAIFVIICSAVLLFSKNIIGIYPPSLLLYKTVGMDIAYPGEHLVFEHLETHVENDYNGSPLLAIQGKIINLSSAKREIPTITATLLGENKEEIAKWNFEAIEEDILSESEVMFHTTRADLPVEIIEVKFSFDNGL